MRKGSFKLTQTATGGAIALGIAIAISSIGIVRAEHYAPDKTKDFTCSSGTACITGDSSGGSTWGIYAEGASNDALHAVTASTKGDSGVAGFSLGTSGNGHGVYGNSHNGDGVYGDSNATEASGVYGLSTGNGWGVYGEAGTVSTYPAVVAVADTDNSWIFDGFNNATSGYCYIDANGDLTCSGTVSGSVMQLRQRSSSGHQVLTYPSQSASATVEDVGTARMNDGVANVQISPDFASVIDHNWYYVFLTPLGDTRGLYVSMKAASGFQVRETEHGRGSLEFDYRIVAHPLGAAADRLPAAPSIRRLAAQFVRR
ncbi:MAG TPA: hypothetical protein VFF63_00770 [Candidatus Babeliales bacterium]|nr:hypothetical protein [Candidatus Babeliales bacterium]